MGSRSSTQKGEYLYVNQAFASIMDMPIPGELIGKTYEFAFDQQESNRWNDPSRSSEKNGRWRGELFAKRKNGSTYFQEASMTMLEDGARVCIIRDITWRKRHEEWLRRSERFFEHDL